ncbi:regulator of RNase E activity RraA [Aliiruegeria haliotis]|uniref:Putative 4-hydroxy-4-methyl-2-oxoglutarate aldolase n=1 Tax=Aliiruegeria haliotis TaxID=1280846 RepID=A0A2T0RDU9_9RHOB|nr:RraA family protein [Aliiruegeria haliotis]PRY19338.1 regulator of RNase E activity RraA [Aliiruegeria haliotis]
MVAVITRKPMEEIVKEFDQFYTGLVYDVLEEMGYPHQALSPEIAAIAPGMTVAGPAFTVQMVNDPTSDPDLRQKRINMFKEMTYPCVDIRDTSFDERVAAYGEMNATLAAKYGCVGAVVDGGTRDSQHLIDRGFPVFARFKTPVEALGRISYKAWQTPIAVRGAITSTVTVNPGDFIFGDVDGVISIPKDILGKVIEKCQKMVNTENCARDEFKVGDPEEVYNKYGRL